MDTRSSVAQRRYHHCERKRKLLPCKSPRGSSAQGLARAEWLAGAESGAKFRSSSDFDRSLPLVAIEGGSALGLKCLRCRSRLARLRNSAPLSERFARCALLRLGQDLVQSFRKVRQRLPRGPRGLGCGRLSSEDRPDSAQLGRRNLPELPALRVNESTASPVTGSTSKLTPLTSLQSFTWESSLMSPCAGQRSSQRSSPFANTSCTLNVIFAVDLAFAMGGLSDVSDHGASPANASAATRRTLERSLQP